MLDLFGKKKIEELKARLNKEIENIYTMLNDERRYNKLLKEELDTIKKGDKVLGDWCRSCVCCVAREHADFGCSKEPLCKGFERIDLND